MSCPADRVIFAPCRAPNRCFWNGRRGSITSMRTATVTSTSSSPWAPRSGATATPRTRMRSGANWIACRPSVPALRNAHWRWNLRSGSSNTSPARSGCDSGFPVPRPCNWLSASPALTPGAPTYCDSSATITAGSTVCLAVCLPACPAVRPTTRPVTSATVTTGLTRLPFRWRSRTTPIPTCRKGSLPVRSATR